MQKIPRETVKGNKKVAARMRDQRIPLWKIRIIHKINWLILLYFQKASCIDICKYKKKNSKDFQQMWRE